MLYNTKIEYINYVQTRFCNTKNPPVQIITHHMDLLLSTTGFSTPEA